jgi:spermidine synthase
MRPQIRSWLILFLFFCSGATALVYEVIWSKFLSQMFGSTIYAQTVVLAVFMGGLAVGNRLVGKRADHLMRPVVAYGLLEILIGGYAVLFPWLDSMADQLFVTLGTPIADSTGSLLFLKGVVSLALLLLPTVLMGGTLPLLASWLQRSSKNPGQQSARFYSVNSLGAVTGAGLAGFCLVQRFGLIGTLQITAGTNLGIGFAAILLGYRKTEKHPCDINAVPEQGQPPSTSLHRAGLVVAVTGAISMGLELLSSRSLALIFGSSLQTFAVVLMAFILGIGLGSAWIASPARRHVGNHSLTILTSAAALWIGALVFNIEHWVDLYRISQTGLARTPIGYVFHQLFATGMSLAILGIPAALIGAVLPLMIRTVAAQSGPLGGRVGLLLTWNTLGAVFGTLFTGFVLMPSFGLRNSFALLAFALAVLGLLVAFRSRWPMGIGSALAASALACVLFFHGNEDWKAVLSSGVFRIRETEFQPKLMPARKEHVRLRFYEDSPDATVSVEETDGKIGTAAIGLRINGKPDASTGLDISTQLLLAHLPMLSKPDAKDVFVLGLGSGMTAGALLPYPVQQIVIAENCKPVVDAADLFSSWNRSVLQDPRTHLYIEDARTVLKLHAQRYDVIITEPSNPWTVGVGSVFSQEFYELAATRLKPGGMVCQWFYAYEMNDDILKLVLRTFASVFPYVEVWDIRNDIVILGSQQPWTTGPEVFKKGFSIERVRNDLEMIDIKSPEMLLARQLASQNTGFAIPGEGPLQSDKFPVLEYGAPKAFFIGSGTRLLDRYDERTRQQLFAPRMKREVLRSLSLENAQYVFADFLTINGELYGSLFGTIADVPCIFRTSQPDISRGETSLGKAAIAFENGHLKEALGFAAAAAQEKSTLSEAGYATRIITRAERAAAR